jgi:hypothetical protein
VTRIVLAITACAGYARADNAKLVDARREIAAVHYDVARGLLVEALEVGGSSPAELYEIYRLSASTAVVLGHADLAEQFYRRWLAVDPRAALGDDESPKLRAPFVAAQAYIQGHGRLVVSAVASGDQTDVAVLAGSAHVMTCRRRSSVARRSRLIRRGMRGSPALAVASRSSTSTATTSSSSTSRRAPRR